jgi:3-oxoacyl-[acyl-carrier protein] reductase
MQQGVLRGKAVIVTGASKGIGAEIARELARAGASVTVNFATDGAGAEKTMREIREHGGQAITVKANVSVRSDVENLFVESNEEFGRIDVVVNNAGVYSFGPLESVKEEEFTRQFQTNVLGALLMSQEAIKHFPPAGASIINIGTAGTQAVLPGTVLYTSTKGALDSITRVLAKELGPRQIRVNSINPGGTETEGAHAIGVMGTDFQKHLVTQTPLGRFGQPSDIGPIAVFLASDAARWLTGEILIASGGMR